jgi:mannose-6-phosphate isomerase-like protein (cupin superfamily)
MKIVSRQNPIKHYHWGAERSGTGPSDGWVLVEERSLSVKLERMPPHQSERMHFHRNAQQFFFILKGQAIFEIENERLEIGVNQGIHIRPGQTHRIMNEGEEDLEVLLSSQPAVGEDRIIAE